MRREILFRAKTIDGNWIEGNLVDSSPMSCSIVNFDGNRHVWTSIKSNTIGQFTELTDKNKKKVFEGDVVRVCNNNNGYFEVCFVNAYVGGWVLKSSDPELNLLSLGARRIDDIEVIGNIHDNPELLN